MRDLITAAFENAVAILRAYRSQLDEGAKLLLARETLTREGLPVLAPYRLAAAATAGALKP